MGKPDTLGTRSKALFEVFPLRLALLFRSRGIPQEHNHLATFSTPRNMSYDSKIDRGTGMLTAHCASLVVNTLALWPDAHRDTTWEMALKLLGWTMTWAERREWPIWTQIPVSQRGFFQEVGFREVRSFTLNLNDFASSGGTDLGRQEWVQMVYSASRGRRVRSVSPPGDRHGRRRRPSF